MKPTRWAWARVDQFADGRLVWELEGSDGTWRYSLAEESGPLSNLDELLRLALEEAADLVEQTEPAPCEAPTPDTSPPRMTQLPFSDVLGDAGAAW